jgi:hypothetical protein
MQSKTMPRTLFSLTLVSFHTNIAFYMCSTNPFFDFIWYSNIEHKILKDKNIGITTGIKMEVAFIGNKENHSPYWMWFPSL